MLNILLWGMTLKNAPPLSSKFPISPTWCRSVSIADSHMPQIPKRFQCRYTYQYHIPVQRISRYRLATAYPWENCQIDGNIDFQEGLKRQVSICVSASATNLQQDYIIPSVPISDSAGQRKVLSINPKPKKFVAPTNILYVNIIISTFGNRSGRVKDCLSCWNHEEITWRAQTFDL